VARCLWEFGQDRRLPSGRLQNCWLVETCGGLTVDVAVTCKPNKMLNVTAEMAALQADLLAAIAAHRAAEQRVVEAELAQNATQAAAAHDATKKELENSKEALYLARERLSGMEAELQETQKQLEANRSLHHAVNQSHHEAREKLRSMLHDASHELNHTRHVLESHRNQSDALSQRHQSVRRSLLGEIAHFEKMWKDEQASHNSTKLRLKAQEDAAAASRSWLNMTLIALAVVVSSCSACVCFLSIQKRQWRQMALSRATSLGAQVVLGRPVGEQGTVVEINDVLRSATPVMPGSPKTAWEGA